MFLRILKKDLKRKKTMNVILLIFVMLAAMFIAGSANNLMTVSNAVDNFLEKAGAPDYMFGTAFQSDIEKFEACAAENGYDYHISQLIRIENENILVDDKKLEYENIMTISKLGGINIFDKNNEVITRVNDGEIYVPFMFFQSTENDYYEGGKILINQNGIEKEFTIKGYTKDLVFGSNRIQATRFLVSENDWKLFYNENDILSSVEIHTKDRNYKDNFISLGLTPIFQADRSLCKTMYIMDMLIAAVLLIVSVCLILISMVILRFIINFTITEEYREIGVMKAIGIRDSAIRGLYIVKYLAISVIGTATGLALSIPFGRLMLSGASQKIIISDKDNFIINIAAAILVGGIVVLFSYFCTRKIRKFSPIDAIHSGETGERFQKKGILRLGGSHMPAVLFMSLNDIFSGIKSYVSMIIIFILGTLLVIIPTNIINTLRSDNIATMFSMAKSDHVVSITPLFSSNENNRAKIEQQFSKIRNMFAENGIDVDVFQELVFQGNIKKGDKQTASIAFIGIGGVTTDDYIYIDGSAPQNPDEVALTHITAGQIEANIGDDVEITIGGSTKTYTITGITQSMTNMGESIRFHQDEQLDFSYVQGSIGIQINYRDNPDNTALSKRKTLLEKLYPDAKVYTCGEYIDAQIGDMTAQLDNMKMLILGIVLSINMLVAVLMVKSFITKEKNEIALLKAIGFKNVSLTLWQTMRIGIVLLVSVLTGALLSSPLSPLIISPIFRIMGAYSIEFEIRPLEVYVVFPLIVLSLTALAAFLSAQGLKKISSAEISNNE